MIFTSLWKLKIAKKIDRKLLQAGKIVNLWIYNPVPTLEAHKKESRVKTNCYKNKKNTIEVLLEWFLTTRTAAITPRISIFTLSLLKNRAVFLMFPNVCLLISQRWKKISTNNLHHCKLQLQESLSLEYEQNRTKLRYWKIVANENFTAGSGDLSSVKKSFWVNHAIKKTRLNPKWKIFGWTNVPDKINWL